MSFFNSVKNLPTIYDENPYWAWDNGVVTREGKRLDTKTLKPLINRITDWFKEVYTRDKVECQAIVITSNDYAKLVTTGAPGTLLARVATHYGDMVIFSPPQVNTPVKTVVPDTWWHTYLMANGISPFLRAHSHHVMPAYQSLGDYHELNSYTLEVVLGQIFDQSPQLAYWLSHRTLPTKDTVVIENPYGSGCQTISHRNK